MMQDLNNPKDSWRGKRLQGNICWDKWKRVGKKDVWAFIKVEIEGVRDVYIRVKRNQMSS